MFPVPSISRTGSGKTVSPVSPGPIVLMALVALMVLMVLVVMPSLVALMSAVGICSTTASSSFWRLYLCFKEDKCCFLK